MTISSRRHQMIVNSHYQHQAIARVVMGVILGINAILITAYLLAERVVVTLATPTNALIVGLSELVVASLVFYISLRRSNKIAGPFYVFSHTLEKVAKGDLTLHVRLRKGDHFQETADVLNDCIHALKEKVVAAKQTADELEAATDADKIKALTRQLKQQLAEFQTEPSADTPQDEHR